MAMPKILTAEYYSRFAPVKKAWRFYNQQDKFTKSSAVVMLFLIVMTPLIITTRMTFLNMAATTGTAVIDPSMQPPTNITTVSLDSTIRANWTATTDPNAAWQVFSDWDMNGTPNDTSDDTLIASKVLGKTANAADANGLQSGHPYRLVVQAMKADGTLSNPLQTIATPEAQSPMQNAAFFENFNDSQPGPLNKDYFDVRLLDRPSDPAAPLDDKAQVFVNEKHFHTQLISGEDNTDVFIRPRVPFDFANHTGTIQFEVDLPVDLRLPNKWWEVNITQDLVSNEEQLGDVDTGNFSNGVMFGMFHQDTDKSYASTAQEAAQGLNLPIIQVNINGKRQEFIGTTPIFTPTNIRIPVVLKLSQTSAEMFINGQSMVKASGFTLPFSKGNIIFMHRGNYGTKAFELPLNAPTLPFQLLHWETIQYDGPSGSYSPVVKTYMQSNCDPVVHYAQYAKDIDSCSSFRANGGSVTLNVPDVLTQAKSARLLFNRTPSTGSGSVKVNGNTAIPLKVTQHPAEQGDGILQMVEADIPVNQLIQGNNNFAFSFSDGSADFVQPELEVIFNQPRIIGNLPAMPMPMIGATTTSFRMERITSDPMVLTGSTSLYSLGSANPVPYTASVITSETPWLKITSPTTGTLISPLLGGGVTPLNFSVDFTGYAAGDTNQDGRIGVIKVTGGNMPVYIAVLRVYYGFSTHLSFIPTTAFPLTTTFNKSAIPDYGSGQTATPTPVSGGISQTAPTPTPTVRPTATPTSGATAAKFTMLPPGSALPSDAQCALRVRRNPWEPRPNNTTANNTNVFAQGARLSGSYLAQYGYETRVTGNFTGTTDEIIQWAACKWGFDEDAVRAVAIKESYWNQSQLGDCGVNSQPATKGCASVGLTQVKGADIPASHPGTWPYAYSSTAFNVDYYLGVMRACFEGKETWLGAGYGAGNMWKCLGRWYSGDWSDADQQAYLYTPGDSVKYHYDNKTWVSWGYPGDPTGGSIPTSTPIPTPTRIPTPTPTRVPTLTPTRVPSATPTPIVSTGSGNGLLGTYFNNMNFTSPVFSRIDSTVNFNWKLSSPGTGVGKDTFSVRWAGYVVPKYSETYNFYTTTDDGVRLWVNGQEIINHWVDQSAKQVKSSAIRLNSGQKYTIQMEFYDRYQDAVAKLFWSSPSQAKQIIPKSQLFTN